MKRQGGWAFAFLVTAGAWACGDTADGGGDEGADASLSGELDASVVDASLEADAQPSSVPVAPNLGPCPSGWGEESQGGAIVCEPFPAGEQTCFNGQMQLPGDADCRAIGADCPAGPWPENLPATGVLYVDDDAVEPFLGTIDSPFSTINQALAAASPGNIVALAKGTYDETFFVDKDLTIQGACSGETIIDGGHSGPYFRSHRCELLVDLLDSHLRLENLTLQDSFALVFARGAASFEASGVQMRNTTTAIAGEFATLVTRNSRIDNVEFYTSSSCAPVTISLPEANNSLLNEAFEATVASSQLEPEMLHLEPTDGPIVCNLDDGATTQVCRKHTPPAIDLLETGLMLATGPLVTIEQSQLAGGLAWRSESPGASLQVLDSRIGGSLLRGPTRIERTDFGEEQVKILGEAVIDQTVGELRQESGVLELSRHQGRLLMVCNGDSNNGALMSAIDVVSRTSGSLSQFAFAGRCDATLERFLLEGPEVGLTVEGGATVDARDLVVRDLTGRGEAPDWVTLPVGLGAYEGGRLSVDRFEISSSEGAGVQLGPNAGSLSLANGLVKGHLVGANVQLEGFDTSALRANVEYEENGVDIDAAELQVPPPIVEYSCDDGIDNDDDGVDDCDDPDCALAPSCSD